MATAKGKPLAYQAKKTFAFHGRVVLAGQTVAAGHELLKGRMKLFEPFQPTHGHISWDAEPDQAEAEAKAAAEAAAKAEAEAAEKAEAEAKAAAEQASADAEGAEA